MLPKRLPSKGLRTPLPLCSEESSTSTKKQNGPFCSPFRLVYRSPPFKPDLSKNRLLQNKRRKKIQLFLASGRSGKWRRHGCLSSQLPLSNIDERASVWKHRVPSPTVRVTFEWRQNGVKRVFRKVAVASCQRRACQSKYRVITPLNAAFLQNLPSKVHLFAVGSISKLRIEILIEKNFIF